MASDTMFRDQNESRENFRTKKGNPDRSLGKIDWKFQENQQMVEVKLYYQQLGEFSLNAFNSLIIDTTENYGKLVIFLVKV